MKIFLTGASGFIGSNLVKSLLEKHSLTCFVRKLSDVSHLKGTQIVYGDIRDSASIKGMESCDLVIHTAAMYKLENFNLEEMYETNVEGTKNILQLCEEYKKPLMYFSTTGVLDKKGELKEKVTTDYGKTKLEAHKLVQSYMGRIPIIILAPSGVFGPKDRSLLGTLLKQYVKKELSYIPCSDAKLSFVFVEDVVKAVELLIREKLIGQYIISAYSMQLVDFLDLCENITRIPKPKRRFSCSSSKFLSLFTGQKKIVDFISDQEYFDSKELRDLGWEPEPIDTALRKTLESL